MIESITIRPSKHVGECGLVEIEGEQKIRFPLFYMGHAGHESGVVSVAHLTVPPAIDMSFFEKVAEVVSVFPFYDWDTGSFLKNIVIPNLKQIQSAMELDDDKMDILIQDFHVLINNWYSKFGVNHETFFDDDKMW